MYKSLTTTPFSVFSRFGAFLTLLLTLAAPGWADTVSYQEASWDGSWVTYTEKAANATPVTGSDTTWIHTSSNRGWYYVSGDVEISERVAVSGTVHLILCDNATLTASTGITVTSGNALTLYAQSDGEAMGKLYAGTTNEDDITRAFGIRSAPSASFSSGQFEPRKLCTLMIIPKPL